MFCSFTTGQFYDVLPVFAKRFRKKPGLNDFKVGRLLKKFNFQIFAFVINTQGIYHFRKLDVDKNVGLFHNVEEVIVNFDIEDSHDY